MWIKLAILISGIIFFASISLTIYYGKTDRQGCPKLVSMWCEIKNLSLLPYSYQEYSIWGIYSDNTTWMCTTNVCSTEYVDKDTVNCSIVSNQTCYPQDFTNLICDTGCYNHNRDNLMTTFFCLTIISGLIFLALIFGMIMEYFCKRRDVVALSHSYIRDLRQYHRQSGCCDHRRLESDLGRLVYSQNNGW